MKKLLLLLLFPITIYSQTQIGNNINGEVSGDYFGSSVSLSSNGNIVAVGANFSNSTSGKVKIYKNNNGIWEQIGNDINGEEYGDYLGESISLSSDGSIIAIGATGATTGDTQVTGNVRVFENISGNWEQIGNNIFGESDNDNSGYSISLSSDGSIIAIGAPFNYGGEYHSGHVRVYKNNNGDWEQIGNDINGEGNSDQSGYSVSLSSDGNIIAIGAPFNNGNGQDSGHVRVYKNNNGDWEQIGNDIDGEFMGNESGSSISLSSNGNIIAIGAIKNDGNGSESGHVRVFMNNNGNWQQVGLDINGEISRDFSGRSVSLSSNGNIVAIGSPGNDVNNQDSGLIRIYQNINNNWEKIGNNINGDNFLDYFGTSVSLSSNGNTVIIGAPFNDVNGSNSGLAKVYDLSAVLSTNNYVLSKFNIYPNPVKNNFTIDLQDNLEFNRASIYNSLGQIIKSSKELTINTSNLNTGIYFIEIETNKGKTTKKLIVE